MAHDVFISYSFHDKQVADAICSALENAGIRCWIAPRDVMPGKEWGEAIVDAIGASKIMVLVFSSASNNSQQVLREVERAVHKNLIIVPFRIENVLPTRSMEYFLYSTHWLDALTPELEKHIDVLIDVLYKLLGNTGKKEPEISQETRQTAQDKESLPIKQPARRNRAVLLVVIGILAIGLAVYVFITMSGRPAVQQSEVTRSALADSTPGTETVTNASSQLSGAQETAGKKEANATGADDSQPAEGPGHAAGVNPPVEMTNGTAHSEPSPAGRAPEQGNGAPQEIQEVKIQLEVGDYIRFGRYNGQPIDWVVIHINDSGQPLLLSSRILTLKPFDASESGTYNQNAGVTFDNKMPRDQVYSYYSIEELRAMKGSNAWANSNIREWLNSDQKKVNYSTQPPSVEAVWYGLNDYDKESGFLYNFTDEEKAMIQKVKHKVTLSETDKGKAVGGSVPYDFSRASLDDVLFNIDDAYYMEVEDRVFLLSVEEAIAYLYDKGHLLTAYLTDEAIRRDESGWYKHLKNQAGGAFMWWLRTPNAQTPCEVCIVGLEGNYIYSDYAVLCGIGVRPALYLCASSLAVGGTGTEEDPYVLK